MLHPKANQVATHPQWMNCRWGLRQGDSRVCPVLLKVSGRSRGKAMLPGKISPSFPPQEKTTAEQEPSSSQQPSSPARSPKSKSSPNSKSNKSFSSQNSKEKSKGSASPAVSPKSNKSINDSPQSKPSTSPKIVTGLDSISNANSTPTSKPEHAKDSPVRDISSDAIPIDQTSPMTDVRKFEGRRGSIPNSRKYNSHNVF